MMRSQKPKGKTMKNSAAAKEVLKECIKHGVLYNYYDFWSKTNTEKEVIEYQTELRKSHKNKYYVLLELCLTFGFDQDSIFDEIQKAYDEKQSRDQAHPTYKG